MSLSSLTPPSSDWPSSGADRRTSLEAPLSDATTTGSPIPHQAFQDDGPETVHQTEAEPDFLAPDRTQSPDPLSGHTRPAWAPQPVLGVSDAPAHETSRFPRRKAPTLAPRRVSALHSGHGSKGAPARGRRAPPPGPARQAHGHGLRPRRIPGTGMGNTSTFCSSKVVAFAPSPQSMPATSLASPCSRLPGWGSSSAYWYYGTAVT